MKTSETHAKKLLYRSWYRGCKETDKILGGYAKKNIEQMTDKEISELEEILEQSDNDIYDWLCGKKPVPPEMQNNSVLQNLFNFVPEI